MGHGKVLVFYEIGMTVGGNLAQSRESSRVVDALTIDSRM
jgi:hypothetical protein